MPVEAKTLIALIVQVLDFQRKIEKIYILHLQSLVTDLQHLFYVKPGYKNWTWASSPPPNSFYLIFLD